MIQTMASPLRSMARLACVAIVGALALGACSDGPAPPGNGLVITDAGTAECTLGSVYPAALIIDPDNPTYVGGGKTLGEVQQMFAEARNANSDAYRAYRAAFHYADVLACAFCVCGCARSSLRHRAAVDCFKDLHGFT